MRSMTGLAVLLGATLALVGCQRGGEEGPAEAAASGNSQAGSHWTVSTSVGPDGALIAEVTPAPGYKVNLEYPWRLTVGDETVRAENAETFTEARARFAAAAPAEGEAVGELRFSVCNASTCLTPRETLRWTP